MFRVSLVKCAASQFHSMNILLWDPTTSPKT